MPDLSEKTRSKAFVTRIREMGWRDASYLEHNLLRVLIDDIGSFTPELCAVQEKRQINAHWIPHFRANSPKAFSDAENGAYWKSEHLYHSAGSFPCFPNFGSGHIADGITHPVNGWTANARWNFVKKGKDEESGAVWVLSTLEAPENTMPLLFRKVDALIPGEPVHYSALRISNTGTEDLELCGGWQNIVGAPFLSCGCRLSASAKEWVVPPLGSEFDATARLAAGKEFISLSKAPLAAGGETDISVVSGPIGWTDFAMGAIPKSSTLGWTAVVNPFLKMVYAAFFPGPLLADENNDIPIYFNDIFMQYGGRPWTPWAPYEGGTDLSYCLGMSGATAAWTSGLEFSRAERKVLGSPVTFTLPAKTEKTLCWGTLFAPYEDNILDGGVVGMDGEDGILICKSAAAAWRFKADITFKVIRRLCQ
ncbi:MAG: hypothetical protein LBD22_05365 [Spirochaetaceae bacterium]|jgi:hypothetical protein|nr:hypothetical protein [Spirochaetaceae bacterium]